ncbi:hypothetical protein AHF37_04591 [Paragonimus kellicotti]|nr:hypothetical protein AHF37_04591 [Paragonimus kellicotti]
MNNVFLVAAKGFEGLMFNSGFEYGLDNAIRYYLSSAAQCDPVSSTARVISSPGINRTQPKRVIFCYQKTSSASVIDSASQSTQIV